MKSKNLLASFKYAICGLLTAFKSERNLKIHSFCTIIVIALGFYFKIDKIEWLICLILISLVIGCELINTSLEEIVNIVSPDIRIGAKKAKDIAAGAVLFFASVSLIAGLIIFLPKILNII